MTLLLLLLLHHINVSIIIIIIIYFLRKTSLPNATSYGLLGVFVYSDKKCRSFNSALFGNNETSTLCLKNVPTFKLY